jgi:probable phosphoglycerate mutase
VPLQIDEGLLELDFGWGEGKTDAEMQEEFPARRAAFLEDPAQNFLPGGENPSAAAARGVAALYRIGEDLPPSGRALAVAHNTLLRLVLCSLLEIPLARYRNCFPILANTTLTEIAFTPTGVGLLQFNVPLDSASGRDHRDPT